MYTEGQTSDAAKLRHLFGSWGRLKAAPVPSPRLHQRRRLWELNPVNATYAALFLLARKRGKKIRDSKSVEGRSEERERKIMEGVKKVWKYKRENKKCITKKEYKILWRMKPFCLLCICDIYLDIFLCDRYILSKILIIFLGSIRHLIILLTNIVFIDK